VIDASIDSRHQGGIGFGLIGIGLRPGQFRLRIEPLIGQVENQGLALVSGDEGCLAVGLLHQQRVADGLQPQVRHLLQTVSAPHGLQRGRNALLRALVSAAWSDHRFLRCLKLRAQAKDRTY
jgi:hypothetical protein